MKSTDLHINSDRLRDDFDDLARIGATPNGGVSRLALSREDLFARSWLAERIEEAGLLIHDDDAGNLSGVLRCGAHGSRTLLLGSHLDTVPEGGQYDGAVGVLAALETLRVVKEAGLQLPFHLEAIDFTDEEGCWHSLFGSGVLTGHLQPHQIDTVIGSNSAFHAAMIRAGIEPRAVYRARRNPESLVGYLELHIEQGIRLERSRTNIGIVDGIVGRATYEIQFVGQAGHSGTTDMYQRRDALRGAALFITRAHDAMRERYGDGIFNCGNVDVKPGKFNIIPSHASLVIEVRHVNDGLMSEMERTLTRIARESAAAHGLEVTVNQLEKMPAVRMSELMSAVLESACENLGLAQRRMFSYSGHDAQMLADFAPTGMILIPSINGVSHRFDEMTRWGDVVNGANVLLQSVLVLAEKMRQTETKNGTV